MRICTKAKAAKLLNVSRATIYAMIKRGELVPNEWGYVDLDQLPAGKDFSKPGRKRKEKNDGENGKEERDEVRTEEIRIFINNIVPDYRRPFEQIVEIIEQQEKKLYELSKLSYDMGFVVALAAVVHEKIYELLSPEDLKKMKEPLKELEEIIKKMCSRVGTKFQINRNRKPYNKITPDSD